MKTYLLNLLELRKRELTNRLNELENQYLSATASGLSGYNASVEEVRREMDRIKICKERLKDLDLD